MRKSFSVTFVVLCLSFVALSFSACSEEPSVAVSAKKVMAKTDKPASEEQRKVVPTEEKKIDVPAPAPQKAVVSKTQTANILTNIPSRKVIDDGQGTVYIYRKDEERRLPEMDLMAKLSNGKNEWQKKNPQRKIVGTSIVYKYGWNSPIEIEGLYLLYETIPTKKCACE